MGGFCAVGPGQGACFMPYGMAWMRGVKHFRVLGLEVALSLSTIGYGHTLV